MNKIKFMDIEIHKEIRKETPSVFKKKMSAGETNVQVVVRVRYSLQTNRNRPRSTKEIKENSQNIITTSSKELVIRTLNDCSKTYTFDKVIGPDATQEHVYDQVMAGMMSEVLEGYNVTVFAYGQTGTGKTFTMLGDEPCSENAGIIPRSLISLFESLEKDVAEYSVRVSVASPTKYSL